MAYTPPAGNAVNFNFAGAYGPPNGNVVNFAFGSPPTPQVNLPTGLHLAQQGDELWSMAQRRFAPIIAASIPAYARAGLAFEFWEEPAWRQPPRHFTPIASYQVVPCPWRRPSPTFDAYAVDNWIAPRGKPSFIRRNRPVWFTVT